MTREEAIKTLKENVCGSCAYCMPFDTCDMSYCDNREAIKALEQEPTTKNDLGVELISRADAIRVASGYCHPSNVAKELAKLPSVTPQEPRTGHWIDEGIYADGQSYHAFMCSECDWHYIGNKSELVDYKYCPFCGAKMVEPQESEG